MKAYHEYNVENFVLDESFQEWVLDPESASTRFWENWLRQNPHKKEDIEKAKNLIIEISEYQAQPEFEAYYQVWENIQKRLDGEYSGANQEPSISLGNKIINWKSAAVWYMAASIMGILLTGILIIYLINGREVVYASDYGATREVVLADGSQVILNANSHLIYYKSFWNNSTRRVELNGEAFFKVRHTNENRPFVVHTNEMDIEVLGTSFNVKNRRGNTEVYLEEGKVRLTVLNQHEEGEQFTLNPGELARVNQKGKPRIKKASAKRYISWTQNKFMFEETPLSRIIQTIEDHFDLEVEVKDSTLLRRKFTATYSANDIDILLRALEVSFQVEIIRIGKKVIFKNKDQENSK